MTLIRPASLADAPAIAAVHVDCWRETYVGLLPDDLLRDLSVARRAEQWANALAPGQPSAPIIFVAEHAGAIAGFVSGATQRDAALRDQGLDGEITAIYLRRALQGQGIGRRLMGAIARALRDHGHRAAGLWVLDTNQPARDFYQACGGVVIGEKQDLHDHVPVTEVAYAWRDLDLLIQAMR